MPTQQPMDMLLINGQILTMDVQMSVHRAIAIRGDRIQAIGDDESLRATTLADTHIVDLQGRTVMPGIIDVHAHLDREGLKNLQPGLEGVRSIAEILDRIKREVSTAEPGEWVVTMPIGDRPNYADMPDLLAEQRFPTRWDLKLADLVVLSDDPLQMPEEGLPDLHAHLTFVVGRVVYDSGVVRS